MIVTVQIADVGPRASAAVLRRTPRPGEVAGLTYAETVIPAPIGGKLLPVPHFGRVGLIAAWEEESALEEFRQRHPLAERLAAGWEARLQPLRVSGAWPRMPGLPESPLPVEDGEPVAVLTLGRPRLSRLLPFLRSAAAMKDYSYRRAGAHQAAVRADRERPYHHESAFVRFRPLFSRGSWDGRDPLAAASPAPAGSPPRA